MTADAQPRVKPSYARQWAVFGVLLAAGASVYYFLNSPKAPTAGRAVQPAGADAFFILRLPELPTDEPSVRAQEKRVQQWFRELLRAEYQPVLLSDALARMERNQELPEKAVAFVFYPGYRRTYEGLAPVLAQFRFPAAWITNGRALDNADERFLSKHAMGLIQKSGSWDTGLFRASSMTFTLEPSPLGPSARQPLHLNWSPRAGRRAVNRRGDLGSLQRLNVNLAWTGPQLVERLDAELPIRRETRLFAVRWLGQTVGEHVDAGKTGSARRFDLAVPPDSRSTSVAWYGTAGCADFRMVLDAASVLGDLWIYLRYDPDTNQGLKIGFTQEALLVIESRENRNKPLVTIPWAPGLRRPIRTSLTIKGNRLSLDANGLHAQAEVPPASFSADRGVLVLSAQSKLRGVAYAKSVSLMMTPL